LCAQPFGWLTLVEVSETLLLPKRRIKGEAKKRGQVRTPGTTRSQVRGSCYCTVLDQAEVSPDSKPSRNLVVVLKSRSSSLARTG